MSSKLYLDSKSITIHFLQHLEDNFDEDLIKDAVEMLPER